MVYTHGDSIPMKKPLSRHHTWMSKRTAILAGSSKGTATTTSQKLMDSFQEADDCRVNQHRCFSSVLVHKKSGCTSRTHTTSGVISISSLLNVTMEVPLIPLTEPCPGGLSNK